MKQCGDDITVLYPLFQEENGGSIPTSPLQLNLIVISPRLAGELNRLWHSVLPETILFNIQGGICYGAEYQEKWYAVAIWTKPIAANRLKDGDKMLELRRLAIADNAPKNTASRMLSIMRKLIKKRFPDIKKLISYQAEEHHTGTIYKAAGWSAVAKSDYARWHPGEIRNPAQTISSKIRWEIELL